MYRGHPGIQGVEQPCLYLAGPGERCPLEVALRHKLEGGPGTDGCQAALVEELRNEFSDVYGLHRETTVGGVARLGADEVAACTHGGWVRQRVAGRCILPVREVQVGVGTRCDAGQREVGQRVFAYGSRRLYLQANSGLDEQRTAGGTAGLVAGRDKV